MPGLNLEKLAWDGNLVDVSRCLLEVYKSEPETLSSGAAWPSSFYTPYQFLLPILQSLYHKLVEAAGEIRLFKTIYEPEIEIVRRGNLRAVNPESRDNALSTSLRAVAYYSWEPGNRLFLVRRVFPTYFDFLSISHIPEGWGASSLMLEQLKKHLTAENGVYNGSFYADFNMNDPKYIRYHLPYIAEQKRLNYQWVVVLPVFQRGNEQGVARSERDMLGTLVFFLGPGGNRMPAKRSPADNILRPFFNNLCDTLSDVIAAHNNFLSRPELANAWKEARQTATKAAVVARVNLSCHGKQCGPGCKVLDVASSEFLQALEGPEYYVLRDGSDEKHEAVFLVAARPSIPPWKFQRNLLRLLTDRLSQQNIACEVTINDHGEQKKEVFLIKSDQGWASNDV